MVNGISNSGSTSALTNVHTAGIQQTQPTSTKASSQTTAAGDTAQLSAAAQAHAMQQAGMSVKAIAANMGISTQDVDSYLGISSISSAGGDNGAATLQSVAAKVTIHGPNGTSVVA